MGRLGLSKGSGILQMGLRTGGHAGGLGAGHGGGGQCG